MLVIFSSVDYSDLEMTFSDKRINLICSILKWFYLVGAIFSITAFVIIYLTIHQVMVEGIIGFLVPMGIFLGLRKRNPLIVPVIVLFGMFGLILNLLSSPKNILEVIAKVFGMFLSLFLIYFFTRKEVRKYFNVKGIPFFSAW